MDDQRVFQLSCHLSQNVAYKFLENIVANVKRGKLLESLQSFVALAPIGMAITPYICAFSAQHKDERFLREVADHFPGLRQYRRGNAQKAWFTDTFTDVNGVSNTIRRVAQLAKGMESPATIITCLSDPPAVDLPLKNFPPLGEMELPEYRSQKISFPPFLEIVRWVEEQGFREIIISTPGPMGLVGLAAAKLLRLRAVGIYHTHFPEYVTQLTGDPAIGAVTGRYMKWFYGQLDQIQVPSEAAREHLIENGYAADRLTVVGRGVDTEMFHPGKRSESFWRRYGLDGRFKFLYVGRVSREKNIEFLLDAFAHLRARRSDAELVVVGDGPLLEELVRHRREDGVHYIGALRGEALSTAYASCEAFVFPSLTDTYGNVVLEAHASGLPAVVLHGAGPGEIVRRHGSGIVVAEENVEWFAEAMAELAGDARRRAALRRAALDAAAAHRWESVVEEMWDSLDHIASRRAARVGAPIR
jgi:glycosyltransferase involved in cell wall biosynthesis